jgi:hypothetical protein
MNMTPKEKAKELVEKYKQIIKQADKYSHLLEFEERHFATQCALTAVDEILNNPKNYQRGLSEDLHDEYWQKVKKEIELL